MHGAFSDCANDIPGIFIETDDITILEFLYLEAYGSGLWQKFIININLPSYLLELQRTLITIIVTVEW